MRTYLAGPMRGIPHFNFPAFHRAAALLRGLGHDVFSPAEADNDRHGNDISSDNPTGNEALAAHLYGFDLREAMSVDLQYICREAEAIALLPGWRKSTGATAEYMVALALDLAVIELCEHGGISVAATCPTCRHFKASREAAE